MSERPQLHLVNAETGELVEDPRDFQIQELNNKLLGALGQIGKLKKENAELRMVEPEAEAIMDVLEYCRRRCNPKSEIAVGGERWQHVRARLRDKLVDRPPYSAEELKLAVDGALLDPWYNGSDRKSKGYLDAKYIFAAPERVEKLRSLAVGFEEQAGIGLATLLDVAGEIGIVDWKHLLRVCMCDHRRLEHSRPDPNFHGREGCLVSGCTCEDFDLDFEDEFNISVDPWLQRHRRAA